MNKKTKKESVSIIRTILLTFISIMLVAALIIGTILFRNLFDYADKPLTEMQLISIIKENIVYTVILLLITMAITIIIYFLLIKKLLKSMMQ